MIEKKCVVSGKRFVITKDDLEFYAKMEIITEGNLADLLSGKITNCVGLPTLCPAERQRRRLSWRNERSLYMRSCDGTGKKMMSVFSPDAKFPVYSYKHWWSDDWDALSFGRNFDFSRPFFEQFQELMNVVPVPNRAMDESTCENSEYCNEAANIKNCYLCFEVTHMEDCMYSRGCQKCIDVSDCLNSTKCEMAYGLVESHNCNYSKYLFDCKNCANCEFCADCIGCNDCFGSVNLRNKEYYFMNQKCTKEAYEEKLLALKKSHSDKDLLQNFLTHKKKFPTKAAHNLNTENCTGEYLNNCKNSQECFSCGDLEDCKYCDGLLGGQKNVGSMDVSHFGLGVEHCYESQSVGGAPGSSFQLKFSINSWSSSDLDYCYFCINGASDCFGCIGLKKQKYCILNKQYSKEKYFELKEKIMAHMKKTGEWGEFFPTKMSPYGYNETVANEYFPLEKMNALAASYNWKDEKNATKIKEETFLVPENIADVSDEILTKVLFCERTEKPYKIQKGELRFYRKMGIEIPKFHPDERYKNLMNIRAGRNLQIKNCEDCDGKVLTTKDSDSFGKILCEKCYLKVVD